MNTFILESEFSPKGDQQQAIDALTEGVHAGKRHQGVAGCHGLGKDVYHGERHCHDPEADVGRGAQ